MEKQIEKILSDLYELEPTLKPHHNELKIIVEQLLKSKPETYFSQEFAANLRAQLVDKFENNLAENKTWGSSLINLFTMKKMYFAGAALVALLAVPAVYYGKNALENKFVANWKPNVTYVKDGAFGKLATATNSDNADQATMPTRKTNEIPKSVPSAAMSIGAGEGGGGGAPATSKGMLVWPGNGNMFKVNYVYEGELKELNAEVAVLKRLKNNNSGSAFADLIKNFDFGLLDLGVLSNSKVEQITVFEDKENGYSMHFNFEEGIAYISKNYRKWIEPGCSANGVCEPKPVTTSDMPSDDTLIAIANDFVKKYDLKTDGYGEPTVNNDWKRWTIQSTEKIMYAPTVVSVIYPLEVNGTPVYSTEGYPIGMNVDIDVRDKSVVNVGNIRTNRYEGSAYAGETDVIRLKKFITQGGLYPQWYYSQELKEVDVNLEEPQVVYMQYWQYANNESTELYLPALLFKAKDAPKEGVYTKDRVIVPLVKEILDSTIISDVLPAPKPIDLPVRIMETEAVKPEVQQ